MNWNNIESLADFEKAVELSNDRPVLIFKHSTRCPVSFMAQRKLQKDWNYSDEEVSPFHLDLIAYRSVSNHIAESTQVQHQSPQILLFKDGKVVYHTSHHEIDAKMLPLK